MVDSYYDLTRWFLRTMGWNDQITHMHFGLIILFGVHLLARMQISSFIPLAAVLAAEFVNEMFDLLKFGRLKADTFDDAFHTIIWPILITIACWCRERFQHLQAGEREPE